MAIAKIIIACQSLNPSRIYFELQEGFSTGYTNEWKASAGKHVTHPKTIRWRKGEFKDFSIDLDLHVGVQAILETPDDLQRVVQWLYDAALPVKTAPGTVSVFVSGPKGTWFSQQSVIGDISVKWQPPYDVDTGQSMRAKVTVSFKPFFGKRMRRGVSRTDRRGMPGRPYSFRQIGDSVGSTGGGDRGSTGGGRGGGGGGGW